MKPIETGKGSMRGVGIRPDTVRECVQLPNTTQSTLKLATLEAQRRHRLSNRSISILCILIYFLVFIPWQRQDYLSLPFGEFYSLPLPTRTNALLQQQFSEPYS